MTDNLPPWLLDPALVRAEVTLMTGKPKPVPGEDCTDWNVAVSLVHAVAVQPSEWEPDAQEKFRTIVFPRLVEYWKNDVDRGFTFADAAIEVWGWFCEVLHDRG